MESSDILPDTPEWRPQSSLSGNAPSTAPSSKPPPPQHSPLDSDHRPPYSKPYDGAMWLSDLEKLPARPEIASWMHPEASTLVEQILCISSYHSVAAPAHSPSSGDSFLDAVNEAATNLECNAKLYHQSTLAELLLLTLDALEASTTSPEHLRAGINLINAVVTFADFPQQSLPLVAGFIASSYYKATSQSELLLLASEILDATDILLSTHLGAQLVASQLELVANANLQQLKSVLGNARFVGAIRLLLVVIPREMARTGRFEHQLTNFIESLRGAASIKDAEISRHVKDTMSYLLRDEKAMGACSEECSWNVTLSLVETCISFEPYSNSSRQLVRDLCAHAQKFEDVERGRLAQLCVNVAIPLPAALQTVLPSRWEHFNPALDTSLDFEWMLNRYVTSDDYNTELEMLIDREVSICVLSSDRYRLAQYAEELSRLARKRPFTPGLAQIGAATDAAATILGKRILRIFLHCVKTGGAQEELASIFTSLCKAAWRSEEIIAFIMNIRNGVCERQPPWSGDTYFAEGSKHYDIPGIPLEQLDEAIMTILDRANFNVYLETIMRLPQLLGNRSQFILEAQGADDRPHFVREAREDFMIRLSRVIVKQLSEGTFREPPANSALSKSDVIASLVETATAIISYRRHLPRPEIEAIVSTVLAVTGSRDYKASIPCIHALTIFCYEIPDITSRYIDDIIDKMSRLVTQGPLAIHVLIYLASLARQPELFQGWNFEGYKRVFGVCGAYLRKNRGTQVSQGRHKTPSDDTSSRLSGHETGNALPQYVYALAHHVIAFWYIAVPVQHRPQLKEIILGYLGQDRPDGSRFFEEQGLVTVDLMDTVDAGLMQENGFEFDHSDGKTTITHRIADTLLVTTETALRTRRTLVTIKRPTNTTRQAVDDSRRVYATADAGEDDYIAVIESDPHGDYYGRVYIPSPSSPLGSQNVKLLPTDNDAVTRAINSIDRTPWLDSHKAGVIYIGEGQMDEEQILQNTQGSPDYVEFVDRLGTLRRLQNAAFNTQGLDKFQNADGKHAVVWTSDLTEIVFHVTTLMPNNEDTMLNTAHKKRHIGNDYVSIIWNNSGRPFDFNTFPSSFNAVYIVISPSARISFLQTRLLEQSLEKNFYRVQVLTRPGYPSISSAASEKIISGASLASYVRSLALNDCVFSLMWSTREGESGEYPSSWRSRMDQLRRLGERYGVEVKKVAD